MVLPYDDVPESSSAAANTVIAAKRPLVVSNAKMFDNVRDAAYTLHSTDPKTMAKELLSLLTAKEKGASLRRERSWGRVAEALQDIL